MEKDIKEAILNCSNITPNIMNNIEDALTENSIEFTHNNESEIIVYNVKKEDIITIIHNIDNIENDEYKLLLQIIESNDKVFIRLKFV